MDEIPEAREIPDPTVEEMLDLLSRLGSLKQ